MMQSLARILVAASLLAGCSSEGSAANAGGGGGGSTGAAGSAGTGASGSAGASGSRLLTGTFSVNLRPAVESTMTDAFSVAGGSVYDGPIPSILPLVIAQEEAGCQLLKPKIPFCAGGCGGEAACVANDICMPYPKPQNVGVVELEGLGSAPVAMDPFPPSFAYQSAALPYPPCAEGEAIRLRGDSFSAETRCIAPLIIATTDLISVKRQQPVKLVWTASAQPDLARIQIRLDVSHHGGKKGELDCDVADTGAFDIPASLVTALIDLGLAGYPTIVVTRVLSAASPEEAAVRLVVSAGVEREVDTGIDSCTEDTDCAPEQLCNKDNLTCE